MVYNQTLVQDVHIEKYENFIKYTDDLTKYIRKEFKLFVYTIEEATEKAIAIEAKYHKIDKKRDKNKSNTKTCWKDNKKSTQEASSRIQIEAGEDPY